MGHKGVGQEEPVPPGSSWAEGGGWAEARDPLTGRRPVPPCRCAPTRGTAQPSPVPEAFT